MDEIEAVAMMYESRDGQVVDDSKTLVDVVVQIARDPSECIVHSMNLDEGEETTFLWLRHTRFVIMDNNTLAFTRPTIPEMVVSSDEDDDNFQGPAYLHQIAARQRAGDRYDLPVDHQLLEAEGSYRISYLRFPNQAQCTAMCNAITAASTNASSQVTIMNLGDHNTPVGLVNVPRDYQLLAEKRDKIAEEVLIDPKAEYSFALVRSLLEYVEEGLSTLSEWGFDGETAGDGFLTWGDKYRDLLWEVSYGRESKDVIISRMELINKFKEGIDEVIARMAQLNI